MGQNANWSLNENQMKTLLNQMAEGGMGRKGLNWLLDNKAYQGALGGGVDAKSDRAFNENLTPDQVRWMMQQPGFSGGLNDQSNQLQGDLFAQFPELRDAYLGGMGKAIGPDGRVVNDAPGGQYAQGGGYGLYQDQGGALSRDDWIAQQQAAYARQTGASQLPPGGGVPNQPIPTFPPPRTGGGQGPGGLGVRPTPASFATDGAGTPGSFDDFGPFRAGTAALPPPAVMPPTPIPRPIPTGGFGTGGGYGGGGIIRRRARRPFQMQKFNPPRV
jgi:hypothetical protein